MATVTAPLVNIAVAAAIPDVVRSCIIPQPPPDDGDDPVGDTGIYTPVPPGITFPDLPPAPTIVDTSPDQMIGCIVTVGDNPQGRLNALFPAAIDGDGVIDRTTNDIWTYDGAAWNNVGPTPGPTLVTDTVIPPWSEILLYDAPLIVGLNVRSFSYALEVLTIPDPLSLVVGLNVVRTMPIAGPYSIAAEVPTISTSASVAAPAAATTLAGAAPAVAGGASVAAPAADIALAAISDIIAGRPRTQIGVSISSILLAAPSPLASTGAIALVPTTNVALVSQALSYAGSRIISHTWSTPGSTTALSQRLGFRFTVGGSSLSCTKLAVYGASSGVERVRIHRVSSGALITSVDITSSIGSWIETDITPVTLSASTQYVISTRRTDGSSRSVYLNPTGLSYNAAIGSVSYWFGTTDDQPTTSTSNAYAFVRFTFKAI